jgi:Acetyltransferase (GNAT) domain
MSLRVRTDSFRSVGGTRYHGYLLVRFGYGTVNFRVPLNFGSCGEPRNCPPSPQAILATRSSHGSRGGRGYAKQALAQVLMVAREEGFWRVIVSCDRDNVASLRVIEANGGVLASDIEERSAVYAGKTTFWVPTLQTMRTNYGEGATEPAG